MKVSQNYNSYFNNLKSVKNKEINNNQNSMPLETKGIMPSADLILSFCGGKSLNLAETIAQIDKYGSYPEDIRTMAEETLRVGNPDKKTLIDIHKSKYADLYACDNLEEVRFFFPEFKDVLSDTQVPVRENSFIDAVKKGEIPYFDKDKDVALQLLQMYWGEGISLSDFKKEFAGRNIYGVFEKLNIPRLNTHYAHYLGFSDKSKNERFVEAMKHRNNSREYVEQQRSSRAGIKRGPLSDNHKAKISESLKKYYIEHPEIAFQLSEDNKRYFEENPEQKEIFSQVLLRAWSYPEAKSIRKALSKYMKRPNITPEELSDVFCESSSNSNRLKLFWDKNNWAKKNFSICMKKSWDRQKYLARYGLIYEPLFVIPMMPKLELEELKKHLTPEQYEMVKTFENCMIPDVRENSEIPPEMEYCKELTGAYYAENKKASNHIAAVRVLSIIMGLIKIYESSKDENPMQNLNFYKMVKSAKGMPKDSYIMHEFYLKCIMSSFESDHKNWAEMIIDSMDEADVLLRNSPDKVRAKLKHFNNLFPYV